MMIANLLEKEFWHESVATWAYALGLLLTTYVVLQVAVKLVIHKFEKTAKLTDTLWDDVLLDMAERTSSTFLLAVGFAVGSTMVDLPLVWDHRFNTMIAVISLVQAGLWGTGAVHFMLEVWVDKSSSAGDAAHKTSKNMARFIGLITVWSAVILVCLENLGIQISTLVAGLGVTGVAVALATQSILGDLFASMSLLLDKPFLVGDTIACDNFLGTVQRIGVKTTRLLAQGGEQLIMANSDLSKSRVRNYKRLQERRMVVHFAVAANTALEHAASLPGLLQDIIESQKPVRFDRAHLINIGDYALEYEAVYWVLDANNTLALTIQQSVYLEIMRQLSSKNLRLTYRPACLANKPS